MVRRLFLLFLGLATSAAAATSPTEWTAAQLLKSGDWRLLREPRYPKGYPWALKDGYLVNTAPDGTPYADIKSMKNGMGLSIYGYKAPLPLKSEVTGLFRIDAASAAGFVLNSGLQGDALTSHYLILIYHKGINVWKYTYSGAKPNHGDYLKLAWLARPLKPDTDYELKVATHFSARANRGHGYAISLVLDGEHVLGVTDPAPFPPGTLALWLGEGYARVKKVTVKPVP